MKKRLLSLALALVLCLGLMVPAFAAETISDSFGDGITVTANPNGTLSYTGTGELYMDHLYMGLDFILYATDGLETSKAVAISIAPGITVVDSEEIFTEMAGILYNDLGASSVTLNGSPLANPVQQQPAKKEEPKPAPAPAPKPEAITEELGDLQVTADPNGTLSYTGAGEFWPDHLFMGVDMLLYVTNGLDGISAVSVNIAPGITYGDDISELISYCSDYGLSNTIEGAFGMIFIDFGLDPVPVSVSRSSAPAQQPAAQTNKVSATPNSATVLVNGKNVAFDAYNIGGNNYFKLRDLAYALNGTDKQFEVTWNQAANAISLTSGKSYTAVGGEMGAKGSGAQSATPTSSKILLDGAEVALTAYNINNNNYFKLRDIGQAFDIGIGWDNATKTITIDTSTGYTE